ncbi:hypothetical protein BC829DRAFT_380874 [Chytridium lagenaria]|nr:hypothetical protein BC829DRAFT_380874 [Chytridium lagenaria]
MNASYNEAIQTEAFDDQNGIPIPTDEKIEDPDTRRKGFNKWPLINGNLKSETVNRYGILLQRPVLLTAHLDTVPVPKETLSKWTYPLADGYVWGRGAHDCKAQVVEILEALENLIRAGFKPTRTILVAFGFDEEIGGMQGAKYLSAGYMDLSVSVRVPGGHSSAPPKHTGIGIAAMVVEALESRPLPLALPGALVEQLGCWNEFGAVEDEGMKKVINDVVRLGDKFKAMLGTTQAVDVIQGGIKVNSLPEQVTVTVNYRIASGSTVSSTEDHVLTSLQSVASLQNLTLVQTRATRSQLHIPPPSSILSSGTLSITTLPGSFDPSPVAPSTSKTFQRISSAIRRTLRNSKSETLVVHPAQGLGNTDTPHYSALVKDGAIYRFSPLRGNDRVHTVDERANVGDVVAASGGVDGDDEI